MLLSRRHIQLDWSLTGTAQTHNMLPAQSHCTVLRCTALWSHLIKTKTKSQEMKIHNYGFISNVNASKPLSGNAVPHINQKTNNNEDFICLKVKSVQK